MDTSVAKAYARDVWDEEVELLRTLAQIPAPTGKEERRAEFVSAWLRDAGATAVEIDEAKNVLCWVAQTPGAGVEVYSAHTDVVFDDLTPLPLAEKGGRMYAPGVGDDTANLVGLLLATRWLLAHPQTTVGRSILVVANSCEEGLGNLRGTRAVYERLGDRIRSHVAFDTRLGMIANEAVGSVRWRVSADGPGGHSFKDFGRPNAIVALARLICALEDVPMSTDATTTHNVGVISGGTTVNSIAAHAEFLYDLRSVDAACLDAARAEFERVVATHAKACAQKGVRLEAELIGQRPGATGVDPSALDMLILRARRAYRAAGIDEVTLMASSTDANIPLSLGIPAICMGALRGAGAHTRDEWIEVASLTDGLVAILCMMATRRT